MDRPPAPASSRTRRSLSLGLSLATALLFSACSSGSPHTSSSTHFLSCASDADCGNLSVVAACGSEQHCVRNSDTQPVQARVVLEESFAGASLDPAVWTFETGGPIRNDDVQYYTDRPENVTVGDGALVLRARAETYQSAPFTSGSVALRADHAIRFGRLEARVKPSAALGVSTNLWLLPANPGAPEPSCDGTKCYSSTWPIWGDITLAKVSETLTGIADVGTYFAKSTATGLVLANTRIQATLAEVPADGYRSFAIEWGPQRIDWYADGTKVHSVDLTSSDIYRPAGTNPFTQPFVLKLNLAVNATANPTDFPVEMRVDQVRVTQYE